MKELYTRFEERQPLLARVALAHLLLFVILFAGTLIDDRVVTGVNIWLKPAKFALSISIYLFTMAWFFGELKSKPRWLLVTIAVIICLSMSYEQVAITMQAARETTSHYHNESNFGAIVFALMGLGVALNTTMGAIVFLLFMFTWEKGKEAYLAGIRIGLLVFLLGSAEGAVMIGSNAHTVGAPDGGPGWWPLFWSTVAGDLRVAHFIGIHGIQVLPLTGFLLDRKVKSLWFRYIAIVAVGSAYALLAIAAYQTAMQGRPGLL